MLLRSTNCDSTLVRTPLRAFVDDIAILSKQTNGTKAVLARLDEFITCSRMKFKAKKSRNVTFIEEK